MQLGLVREGLQGGFGFVFTILPDPPPDDGLVFTSFRQPILPFQHAL